MNLIKIPLMITLLGTLACGGTPQNTNSAATPSPAPMQEPTEADEQGMDIVATAKGAGQFNTLIAALEAADLVSALEGEGPFTVFAPTDAAFAKLPPGTVEALLQDKQKLAQILTYHVVSGKVMAADVVKLTSATTLQGQSVAIDASSGVRVDDANVVTADIQASNGVVHVIDTVLIPKEG